MLGVLLHEEQTFAVDDFRVPEGLQEVQLVNTDRLALQGAGRRGGPSGRSAWRQSDLDAVIVPLASDRDDIRPEAIADFVRFAKPRSRQLADLRGVEILGDQPLSFAVGHWPATASAAMASSPGIAAKCRSALRHEPVRRWPGGFRRSRAGRSGRPLSTPASAPCRPGRRRRPRC